MTIYQNILINTIVPEIINNYSALRRRGKGREEALTIINEIYQKELKDEDDGAFVIIGQALALAKKSELTEPVRKQALIAIDKICKSDTDRIAALSSADYRDLLKKISEDYIGPEAHYQVRKLYDPMWSVGDTFVHPFKSTNAEQAGMLGWGVLFRKVGELEDSSGHHRQLVYVTVCPLDKIPRTENELKELGFLRMMKHDQKWDYLAQVSFKSKADEDKWELQKIGSFSNAGEPYDATIEDPLVSMPLFGKLKRNSQFLAYEVQVCNLIQSNGICKLSI